jgi:hypothetical protein
MYTRKIEKNKDGRVVHRSDRSLKVPSSSWMNDQSLTVNKPSFVSDLASRMIIARANNM